MRAALTAGHAVSVVPGPTAAVAALVVSGLPTGRFVFEGFLPRRGRERARRLDELTTERRTIVIYESPHRIEATLTELAEVFGPARSGAVARELTKLHEEMIRGPLSELADWAKTPVKGEIVVIVDGAPPAPDPTDDDIVSAVRSAMGSGSTRRDASGEVAARFGIGRRRVYELALADSSSGDRPR